MIYSGLKHQGQTYLGYQYTLKKMKGRRLKQVFSRGRYQWEVGEHKEKANEGEYSGCTLYPCVTMEE
jgi:hypothetical protein